MISLLKKFLSSWRKKPDDLYDSISTLPMINWIDVRAKGDFRYLLHEYKEDISLEEFDLLETTYYKIIDEFWNRFGQAAEFKEIVNKKHKLHLLNLKILETGDRFLLNERNILQSEINEDIEEDINEINSTKEMQKEFAIVNKEFNSGMSISRTTVLEFYINRSSLV